MRETCHTDIGKVDTKKKRFSFRFVKAKERKGDFKYDASAEKFLVNEKSKTEPAIIASANPEIVLEVNEKEITNNSFSIDLQREYEDWKKRHEARLQSGLVKE